MNFESALLDSLFIIAASGFAIGITLRAIKDAIIKAVS
jgi:hypothetical protein